MMGFQILKTFPILDSFVATQLFKGHRITLRGASILVAFQAEFLQALAELRSLEVAHLGAG